MIDRFHADDLLHQPRLMLVDVLHQLGLGVCRARDQDRARAFDRLDDAMKKVLILRGVPAADGVCLV